MTTFYQAACNANTVFWWEFCLSICPSVYLSVCLYVTRVYSDKTLEISVQIYNIARLLDTHFVSSRNSFIPGTLVLLKLHRVCNKVLSYQYITEHKLPVLLQRVSSFIMNKPCSVYKQQHKLKQHDLPLTLITLTKSINNKRAIYLETLMIPMLHHGIKNTV